MQKPLVFISHIAEEKEIAQALKRLVETTFLNMIEVFVSSDPNSIKPGRKWLNEITDALKCCSVEIILASPESVKRPWVNFEGGSGWIRDIPVIPLCHSGMVPAKLPAPLGSLQAATATEEASLKLIFPVLADAVGCTLPDVDFSEFISVVRGFEATSREFAEMATASPIAATEGLSHHEWATLAEIAEQAVAPDDVMPVWRLRDTLEKSGYRGIAVSLALKMLARKNWVELSKEPDQYNNDEYAAVRLTDEGWTWLEANQDRLTLTWEPTGGQEPAGNEQANDDIPF